MREVPSASLRLGGGGAAPGPGGGVADAVAHGDRTCRDWPSSPSRRSGGMEQRSSVILHEFHDLGFGGDEGPERLADLPALGLAVDGGLERHALLSANSSRIGTNSSKQGGSAASACHRPGHGPRTGHRCATAAPGRMLGRGAAPLRRRRNRSRLGRKHVAGIGGRELPGAGGGRRGRVGGRELAGSGSGRRGRVGGRELSGSGSRGAGLLLGQFCAAAGQAANVASEARTAQGAMRAIVIARSLPSPEPCLFVKAAPRR